MQKLLRNPEQTPDETTASVDWLLKDVNMVARSIEGVALASKGRGGLDPTQPPLVLPLLARSQAVLARSSNAGVGDKDISVVAHFLDAGATDADVVRDLSATNKSLPMSPKFGGGPTSTAPGAAAAGGVAVAADHLPQPSAEELEFY